MAGSARVRQVLEEAATLTVPERVELVLSLARRGLVTRRDYERYVSELEDITAKGSLGDLQAPVVFTTEDMARQRKAILEFLSIPTVSGTPSAVARDKYSVLGKHDVEV
jgi:hypothetical protein